MSSNEPNESLAATGYMGAKAGKRGEVTMFYTVKPGHQAQIRQEIENFYANPNRTMTDDPRVAEGLAVIGVHDMRHVLFDNDTRLLWITSFDTEWDPYIDDTFRLLGPMPYGKILQHTVEAPEGIADPDSPVTQNSRAIKDIFNANRVVAVGFAPTFPDLTVREIQKGERLRRAFQEVLDHPDAEQALRHPALKPLLDEAAD